MTSVQVRQLRHPKYQLEHLHKIHKDTYSQIYVCFLREYKCKMQGGTMKSKRATQQFLRMFSFILSSNVYYFLRSCCRNSSHGWHHLIELRKKIKLLASGHSELRIQVGRSHKEIKRELSSTWTAHLSFLWIHQYQTKQESGSLSETFPFKPS